MALTWDSKRPNRRREKASATYGKGKKATYTKKRPK